MKQGSLSVPFHADASRTAAQLSSRGRSGLERKCACGQHASGGECQACRKHPLRAVADSDRSSEMRRRLLVRPVTRARAPTQTQPKARAPGRSPTAGEVVQVKDGSDLHAFDHSAVRTFSTQSELEVATIARSARRDPTIPLPR